VAVLDDQRPRVGARSEPAPGRQRVADQRAERDLAVAEPRGVARAQQPQRERQPCSDVPDGQGQRAAAEEEATGETRKGRGRGERLDLLDRDMSRVAPRRAAADALGVDDDRREAAGLQLESDREPDNPAADDEGGSCGRGGCECLLSAQH
jgi:hypothetical protein